MAELKNTTITDKNSYKIDIIDTDKYNSLSEIDRKIFEVLRNSMLEIFPVVNNKHDELSVRLAENHAFVQLNMISLITEKIKSESKNG